jgi:hypothetical protein
MEDRFDISGYRIFSEGREGAAHVLAHHHLDTDAAKHGYVALGQFLAGAAGTSSEHLHLQWHMLVFEIAVGRNADAFSRFREHLLPFAGGTNEVATDAPAALLRLEMAGVSVSDEIWQEVCLGARRRIGTARSPYVKLHDALALSGAKEVELLRRVAVEWSANEPTLGLFARGFAHLTAGEPTLALHSFDLALPQLGGLGGSRAQNQMFWDLAAGVRREVVFRSGTSQRAA